MRGKMTSVFRLTGQRGEQIVGVGLVNLATLTWAVNMALGRWLRVQIGPLTLATLRVLIASLLFAALLRSRPAEERRLGNDLWLLLGMGLSGVAIFNPLAYSAVHFTTAVNATLLNGLCPLITGLLAALLIGEPMSRRQMAGAGLGLTGVAILISGGSADFFQAVRGNVGDLLMMVAVTFWGLSSVLSRRVTRHRSPISASAFATILSLPPLLLASAWELQSVPVATSAGLILAVLYIGSLPAMVGFLAWNAGIRRLGASGAMVFFNTLPLYGALIGCLFLGESFGLPQLIGGALIVGGGLWASLGQRQQGQ